MDEIAPGRSRTAMQGILASSALMAVGTLFSRFSGLIRSVLLAAALGSATIAADGYTVANTIPNMLYILLAGGVFNAVLVPQLVRALKNDPDGGEAYTHRIITLGLLFLGTVTVLLVVFAPLLMRVVLDGKWFDDDLAVALDSVITLARWCLPQVFFYGMFTLVGQVLNARGSFGPMMWAPIANNLIAVGVLATYLFTYGPVAGLVADGHFTDGQMALLGLGSTVGIAVQLLVLLPFLRRAGYRFRPRFDFRGTGLGHTLRLGIWTVLFVVVNQVAYVVVVRLLSDGTASGEAGQFVYSNAYMITLLPHGVITVSLVTALLPRLSAFAAEHDGRSLGRTLTSTLRTALLMVLPFAAVLPILGTDVANVLYGYGASKGEASAYAGALAFFGVALVFFTVHYFMLRGFYALERTRTVFLIQLVVAGVNITAALVFTALAPAGHGPAALAAAYASAYACGAGVSWLVLRRALGGLDGPRMLRFAVRIGLVTAVASAVSWGVWWLLGGSDAVPTPATSFVRGAVVGVVHLGLFLALARLLHIRELTELLGPLLTSVRRRLPGR
ncbi:murein biosynthesis integral membrane protein MurJ [Nocardioides sp. Y6]|uniref:Murein biosynthesis integral membrane protein MurJ n=2 Tax=Nocardioides malaquae TaxID=2773426 RepID=A0ABR9RRP2_9ACTN|nr:murein biosynthesis integral membrane protein MurJ [Nocardioides malaquae]